MSSNFRAANSLPSNIDGAGVRVGLVCGRWNDDITNRLIEGAEYALAVHGVAEADVIQVWVPGAYEAPMAAKGLIDSGKVDVVVSDMAPNLSGIASADSARVAHLIELAVDFAVNHLKAEGALVVKSFHGGGYDALVALFRANFRVVKAIKPKSSRDKSSETFLVGMGLKVT